MHLNFNGCRIYIIYVFIHIYIVYGPLKKPDAESFLLFENNGKLRYFLGLTKMMMKRVTFIAVISTATTNVKVMIRTIAIS